MNSLLLYSRDCQMDPLDKRLLATLYSSMLDPSISAYDRLKARLPIRQELYNSIVSDLIHPGHIHTLKAAKAEGDVLVVVVARQSTAQKIKKYRRIYHNEKLRKDLVTSLNFVDLAIIGKEGTLYDTVEYVKPNVIALGYDQAHSEKEIAENCKKRNLNVQVIRLSTPIPGSKSSKIKEELGDSIYGI